MPGGSIRGRQHCTPNPRPPVASLCPRSVYEAVPPRVCARRLKRLSPAVLGCLVFCLLRCCVKEMRKRGDRRRAERGRGASRAFVFGGSRDVLAAGRFFVPSFVVYIRVFIVADFILGSVCDLFMTPCEVPLRLKSRVAEKNVPNFAPRIATR